MMLVLSLACTLAAHDYYFMQLPPILLLSALSHIPMCGSVPYPCTFHQYFGLGSMCPPLTFWAHRSLLHWQFLLLRPLAPCRNTCLPLSLQLYCPPSTSFNGALSGLEKQSLVHMNIYLPKCSSVILIRVLLPQQVIQQRQPQLNRGGILLHDNNR